MVRKKRPVVPPPALRRETVETERLNLYIPTDLALAVRVRCRDPAVHLRRRHGGPSRLARAGRESAPLRGSPLLSATTATRMKAQTFLAVFEALQDGPSSGLKCAESAGNAAGCSAVAIKNVDLVPQYGTASALRTARLDSGTVGS
jgi:hypothetical protein